MIKIIITLISLSISCAGWAQPKLSQSAEQTLSAKQSHALPRSAPEAEGVSADQIQKYLEALAQSGQEVHSLMIMRHGKVVFEKWWEPGAPDKPHIMNSVSKGFAATAIGFAINEGLISLTDKVISFFPDSLPQTISPNLAALEIQHLLSMTVGQSEKLMREIEHTHNWTRSFLSTPIDYAPGTVYVYNSIATYMLSAIIYKLTGMQLIDYLQPRLFEPLGIQNPTWSNSPEGINIGGWGLYLKTEDMAKFGQLFLQKGVWNGKQLLPKGWVEEATTLRIYQEGEERMRNAPHNWNQGYGYQMFLGQHNAYRWDGADSQYIIVLPLLDAIIVTTAYEKDMEGQLNLIWSHLLPAFGN